MQLSILEVRILNELARRGPCAASTIMPHVEGLDSKAQLKGTLEGLEKKELAKYQSNGQWAMPAALKKKVLDGKVGATVDTTVTTPPVADIKPAPVSVKPKVAAKQKPTAPASGKQAAVKVPVLEMSEPASTISPLQALRNSLPPGVEMYVSDEEAILHWEENTFKIEDDALDTALGAIRTLERLKVGSTCS
ncbi:hypothetical protein [Marinobacterium litorale]|uniref:hypothetical protein n=1 Tax=Marinobacterium litorale TaxID=404770 RepID=UPI00041798BD|nr:hypothetical protein [Marinobacterium litorale]